MATTVKKKNAFEEARDLFKRLTQPSSGGLIRQAIPVVKNQGLVQQGMNLIQGKQNTAPVVGGVAGHMIQNRQNIMQEFSRPRNIHSTTPNFGLTNALFPKEVAQPIQSYVQNQIVNPAQQSNQLLNRPGLINKGLGALSGGQAIFNATPMGVRYNVIIGSLAGSGKSLRTGQPLNQSVLQGITQPTSIGSEGLGLSGWAATGVDLATGFVNPKSLTKVALKGKNLVREMVGVNPKAFDLHPDDANELAVIGEKLFRKQPLNQVEFETVERTFKYLFPKMNLDKTSNKKIQQVIAATLDRYNGIKGVEASSFPSMGFVKKDQSIKQSQLPSPEIPPQNPTISQGIGGSSGGPKKDLTSSSGIITQQTPYFNLNRMRVKPKAREALNQVISDTKPKIEAVVGKPLSNDEVINLANNSAKIIRKTIGREETAQFEAALLRARQLLAQQANDGKVTQEYIDNLIAIKSIGTDLGRKLQSLSINADPKGLGAKEAILEAVIKVNQNTDEILAAAKNVDFNDAKQATAFYRQFVQPKAEEWLDLLRYNSMLSSPNTHIVNMFSNLQGLAIAPIEKTLLGGVDFLKSAVTGAPRQYLAGEGVKQAQGTIESIGQAAHNFAEVMRGNRLNMNPDVRNIPLTTGGAGRVAENALSFPLKLLEASDQFFTTLVQGGAKKAIDYKMSKGIKVANPELKASQEAAYRLFRQDLFPEGQGNVLGAIDSITQSLFSLRNNNNPIVRNIAKFTIPFIKTPINILKQGVEYSPAGFSTLWGSTSKTEQFTKALMGSSIALGTGLLLASDRVTWEEPADKNKKNAFRAAGMQPYSIKIGDQWVSYQKLHPALAFNFALMAGVKSALDNKKIKDGDATAIMEGLSSWISFFADQSFVKNIGDFIASTKGDVEGPLRYFSNYPTQLIPGRALLSWVNRIIDPYQRQVPIDKGALEKQFLFITSQIPILAQQLPIRTDKAGNQIKNQNRLFNAVSPIRTSTENPELKNEFNQLNKIGEYRQQATLESSERSDRFDSIVEKFNAAKSPEERKQILLQGVKTEEELNQVISKIEESKMNLSTSERSLKSLPITQRAQYINDQIKNKTPEEKKAYLLELARKKILTENVLDAMIE